MTAEKLSADAARSSEAMKFLSGAPRSITRAVLNEKFGGVLLSHTLPSAVPSALLGLASGFGMEPGVSPTQ